MLSPLVWSFAFVLVAVRLIEAHGTVHDPPARQTRWRYDRSAIPNYDDRQLFCGGLAVSAIRKRFKSVVNL